MLISRVVEQKSVCDNEKNDGNYLCKNGDSGHDRICMKESKSKKKKRHISVDLIDGCNAVNEDVQACELLPKSLNDSAECTKQKVKKRKKKGEDNVGCLSDEQYVTEKSQSEELWDGVQHALVEKETKKRHEMNGNDVDMKLESDISGSITRGSECANTGPGNDSVEGGVLNSIGTGSSAETVQDNGSLLTKDANAKRRRKRTRRHKKGHASEHSKTTENLSANITDPKIDTFIRSVAAPRTHIRFSDWDGDVSTETTVNAQVETYKCLPVLEFEPASSTVNGEVSSLQPSMMSSNVVVASSELNGKEAREQNSLASREEISTKWDVEATDSVQCVDFHSGSSLNNNNNNFAKLLTFQYSSTPHVYQRKKNFITADTTVNGTIPKTPSGTDLGNEGQIEVNKTPNLDLEHRAKINIVDERTDFSQYPFIKEMPKEKDFVAFKVGLAYNICSLMFLCLWCFD
jgi:hypothetical protein